MQSLEQISQKLDNTYWIGPSNETVYGIFLYSPKPFVNTDYPYQLSFRFYSSGYKYVADTIQMKGGLSMKGFITYGNGLNGRLVGDNKIVNIPAVTTIDQYSSQYVNDLQQLQSTFINNRMNATYPRSNEFVELDGHM
jgi:hypothetical protein